MFAFYQTKHVDVQSVHSISAQVLQEDHNIEQKDSHEKANNDCSFARVIRFVIHHTYYCKQKNRLFISFKPFS